MKRIDASYKVPKKAATIVPSRIVLIKALGAGQGSEERAEALIPFCQRRGPLLVGARRPGKGLVRTFAVRCDCGRILRLRPTEIVRLLEEGKGCQSPGCDALGFRETVWTQDLTESLRLQLGTLVRLFGDEVQSWWGGRMDDLYDLPFEIGLAHFLEHIGPVAEAAGPWICRKDPNLPFADGNVELGTRPDPAFSRLDERFLEVDGQKVRVQELCDLAGLSPPALMLKVFRLGACDDLMFKLIAEEDDP